MKKAFFSSRKSDPPPNGKTFYQVDALKKPVGCVNFDGKLYLLLLVAEKTRKTVVMKNWNDNVGCRLKIIICPPPPAGGGGVKKGTDDGNCHSQFRTTLLAARVWNQGQG